MMSLIGFHYLKAPATMYVVQYRGGKMRRKGTGLAFYYFAPWSVIAQVPTSTLDVPFAFTEVSSDFQDVIAQGTVTYRVANPEQLLTMLDYSVDRVGRYTSDDPSNLTRTVSFTVNDGDVDSNTLTRDIDIIAVNDDPTNAASMPSDISVTEDVSSDVDLSAINLSDVDHNGALL